MKLSGKSCSGFESDFGLKRERDRKYTRPGAESNVRADQRMQRQARHSDDDPWEG
jgi:hypothetical protein